MTTSRSHIAPRSALMYIAAAVLAAIGSFRPAVAAEIYVSNQHGGVTVLDSDTLAVTRQIDPEGIESSTDGRIVELGRHNDLIEGGGHYQALYEIYQELAGERGPSSRPPPQRPDLVMV